MKKIKLIPSSVKEQQKIAPIISNADELVKKQEINRSKPETLKKGLMQQPLTGKIRVKD